MSDIRLTVNGESRSAPAGISLLEFLHLLGVEPSRVAVELDRVIVKRPDWGATTLREGAALEIVHFVGGG